MKTREEIEEEFRKAVGPFNREVDRILLDAILDVRDAVVDMSPAVTFPTSPPPPEVG